jgi:hypothetical protein
VVTYHRICAFVVCAPFQAHLQHSEAIFEEEIDVSSIKRPLVLSVLVGNGMYVCALNGCRLRRRIRRQSRRILTVGANSRERRHDVRTAL